MSVKKILGIIFVVVGIAFIYTSTYIKGEVEEGRGKIRRGQEQVDQGKRIFNLTPHTAPVGDVLTAPAQSKINQGRRDIVKYQQMSYWFMGIGVACIIIGVLLFFSKRKTA